MNNLLILRKGQRTELALYLHQDEFDCKCSFSDCKITVFSREIGISFRLLRSKFGFPVLVTSGYRCPRYNQSLPGSSLTSFHQVGCAIDLKCPQRMEFNEFAIACSEYFKKTIRYPKEGFIHCQVII